MCQIPGRFFSSWGCVQALIVTFAILLLPFTDALEPKIDLLEALNLRSNISRYTGIRATAGSEMTKRAYHLMNEKRNLMLPPEAYIRASELIKGSTEFTLSATIKQEIANSGTIISFSRGINRYLELQSSGRKDEIRFHYTWISSDGKENIHTETFPYRMADNAWHKLSLSVSGPEVQILIDCMPIYRRIAQHMPDRSFGNGINLFVGQRSIDDQSVLKGDIEDTYIITGPYGYLRQCPDLSTNCPTCGEFNMLQNTIKNLMQKIDELKLSLSAQEDRLIKLESCDCRKSCKTSTGETKREGDIWESSCKTCACEKGVVTCEAKKCNETLCKYPEIDHNIDACCPVCLKSCLISGRDIEHGDNAMVSCQTCKCGNGSLSCQKVQCPQLSCAPEQQIQEHGVCCQFCPGEDYCSKGHACHTNATCLNLNTKYSCICDPGFQGDGFDCSDIDECKQQGDPYGNHCHLKNTRCVNTNGSYLCECKPGYRRIDKFSCSEVDECATGKATCHEHAECTNTPGSYRCQCKEGYSGNGFDCIPVCNQTCLNGGLCTSPGYCSCRNGYIGEACEQDLDECAAGLHTCKSYSYCVNMPGWYYCKCKPGYETNGYDCHDINECARNTHSCHPTATCINSDGHFGCFCADDDPECRLSCIFEDREIPDGGITSPRNQPCKVCTCNKGVITCSEPTCNCTAWKRGIGRDLCCPQCDPKESCQHQELKHVYFHSGEQWIYQCQTCECLYGEFDCWKLECPPLTCSNPLPLAPGDCCPRCEDDPCNFLINSNNTHGLIEKPCTYKGDTYASGEKFSDTSSQCTTCACKDSQLCCSFDPHCYDAQPVAQSVEKTVGVFSKFKNNPIHTTSKATTIKSMDYITSSRIESATTLSKLSLSSALTISPASSTTNLASTPMPITEPTAAEMVVTTAATTTIHGEPSPAVRAKTMTVHPLTHGRSLRSIRAGGI